MSRRAQYAAAFHAQAKSDWEVYELLSRTQPSPRPCHSLHYLQVACEKLGKSYRLRHPNANVDVIATRHVGFAQFINDYLRSPAVRLKYPGKTAALNATCKASAAIAREIEKLAPAVDRACSPENAEYPWERGDWEAGTAEVLVPCVYAYPSLALLKSEKGRAFLKIVQEALRDWTP